MYKTKVACFNNYYYCKYPDSISNMDEFIEYLNNRHNAFVKLEFYIEKNCVAPFFIEGNTEIHYLNVSNMRFVKEEEISILSEEEYAEKLKAVIAEKCVHCVYYSENVCEEDNESHSEHISLDGVCYGFERKSE